MYIVRFIALALLCFSSFSSLEAGLWDSFCGLFWKSHVKMPPMIDVLIAHDQPSVLLEVKGRYQLVDPHTREIISKRYMGKKKNLESRTFGLKWGEEFPGIFQLHIVPESSDCAIFVDHVEYRGSIFIYDIGGAISIVNRVSVEEYLLSILPANYPRPLSQETLSAIAIAARTDAYYQSQNPKNRYWAVDGRNVGYQGLNSHAPESAIVPAICATRHMILSHTGRHEGIVAPFPTKWSTPDLRHSAHQHGGYSRISIEEAEEMAERGSHAAQILSKAYPGSHIEIVH